MRKRVKVFKTNKQQYAFDGDTFELFIIEDKNSFNKYVEGQPTRMKKNEEKGRLSKVVLNVSNSCNLNCKYCYADGGNYGRSDCKMSQTTFDSIVEQLQESGIKKIDIFSFFGGEPTLNYKLIKYAMPILACSFEIRNYELVTNGTMLTEEMISFFNTHKVHLSISIDGPKYITDALRGKGTFALAERSINSCKKLDYQFLKISGTYTKLHEHAGLSYRDTYNFLRSYDVPFTLNRVITDNKELKVNSCYTMDQMVEDVRNSINAIIANDNRLYINPYLYRVLLSMFLNARSETFCDDLKEEHSITFDYDGTKYNCFRFWNDNSFAIVNGANRKIMENNCKDSIDKCKTCWASGFCKICIAAVMQGVMDFPVVEDKCVDMKTYEIVMKEIINCIEAGRHTTLATNFVSNFLIYK